MGRGRREGLSRDPQEPVDPAGEAVESDGRRVVAEVSLSLGPGAGIALGHVFPGTDGSAST